MAALVAAGLVVAFVLLSRSDGGGSNGTQAVVRPLPAGPAYAGGVVVAEPMVDLGRVPLDVVVQHTFRLRNIGPERVYLGRPTMVALEGC